MSVLGWTWRNARQLPGRHAGEKTDHPQHQTLWTGGAHLRDHSFGPLVERMHQRPEQLHELQYVRQGAGNRSAVGSEKRHCADSLTRH